jgi:hypothetical protein
MLRIVSKFVKKPFLIGINFYTVLESKLELIGYPPETT